MLWNKYGSVWRKSGISLMCLSNSGKVYHCAMRKQLNKLTTENICNIRQRSNISSCKQVWSTWFPKKCTTEEVSWYFLSTISYSPSPSVLKTRKTISINSINQNMQGAYSSNYIGTPKSRFVAKHGSCQEECYPKL